jgi:6,7-dimethyl-8-ribityllumazine synthase
MYKVAIVYSNYYEDITQNLITEFKRQFELTGKKFFFEEHEVFGVSEIPFQVNLIEDVDAIAVFGCVLMGETYHHELINNYVFDKVYDLSLEKGMPLGYGILNVKTLEQAKVRCLPEKANNRGYEAFMAIAKQLNLL